MDQRQRRRVWLLAGAGVMLAALITALVIVLLPGPHEAQPTARPAAPLRVDAGVDVTAESAIDAAATVAPAPDARARPRRGWRGITDRELRTLQRRNSGLLRACYMRTSRRAPAMARGRADVVVQLGNRGRVRSVQVTAGDRALEGCLRRAVLRWRFSPTLRAQRVTFPVVVTGR